MASGVRARFDEQLSGLTEDVLRLGSLAREAVRRGVQALVEGDDELAREVIGSDSAINSLRYEVERECSFLLATEQPVAGDMRVIVSALIVSSDLERIGDHGKKIAQAYLRMLENPRPIPVMNIERMAAMALALADRALAVYASQDIEEARAICNADDDVDAFYKQTFNVILSYMLENSRLIGPGTHLLQVAHELERVADRATNVAERVIYSVTGELQDLNA
jgi:phosphate transport system protein